MNWIEIRVHTSREAEEAVAHLLMDAGAEGTATLDSDALKKEWDTPFGEIIALKAGDYPDEGVWISAYFPQSVCDEGLPGTIEDKTRGLAAFGLDPGPATVLRREVAEESWADAWKTYYKPVRITDRLTVKPVWEEYRPASGEAVIELDPGMAFGTGTHPTTTLSMRLLEKALSRDATVIDVGCGSGILAIAAAKLGAREVTALDLDPVAVHNARANVRRNGADDRVEVRQGDLLNGVEGSADVVVANILAEIILRVVPDLSRVLKPGGTFIASGIIRQKEEDVTTALSEAGFRVVERMQSGDWVALAAET